MVCTHITGRHSGNWIINLTVLLCNLNIIISQSCDTNNGTIDKNLPENWPCEWSSGRIPYVFNFYTINVKRLIILVRKGHEFLQKRSCLQFVEMDPREVAKRKNFTFLYYNYSGVLENCCLKFYSKPVGRRTVLITPVCKLAPEVAHATLHGLGIRHGKREAIDEVIARSVLFPTDCPGRQQRMDFFDSKL